MDYADMRPADFARLVRLRVFRVSGSEMGNGVINALAPFHAEKEKSLLERGKGKGKGREQEQEREEGVDPNSRTQEIAESGEKERKGEMGQGEGGEGEGDEWTIRLPHLEHLELRGCVRLSLGARAIHRRPCPFPPQRFSPQWWRFSLPGCF
ncbi:hypothetical protein FIBSPDRAFT_847572 [Athelia psychrophila]|uniref:Uncharacterized protein n=1 Tax=Athelia psychrophila TaxID=1759441 RepID=A0A166WDG4_9AGAM|nr:hypothetical protein FIBSPDRAFT_847572 [Fibularhizoctonia sp. CBS 109695]